jgi:type II restriction/modification system DNA methylase subunit YeeA
MQELETENNRLFIEAYGLQEELTPEVSEDQITLARADREADMKRLISYAICCMMGRYSLDRQGLVYAHSGNEGFDPSKYPSFPASDDGIIPVTDMEWFPDDAANRLEEFLKVAWSPDTLEENLKFIADSLSPTNGEQPRDRIRRYISNQFFKDHLQTYRRRPIYWLFSSGKQKAFECLVYLHRYNEATLSRIRNEYVTPLHGKLSARAEWLKGEADAAPTTSTRNRLEKELETIKKKQVELAAFDDLLRHYADQRISIDLDDGVKVNYGKFGDLLSEVKAVTGE